MESTVVRACSIGAGPMGRALLDAAACAELDVVGAWAPSEASRELIARRFDVEPAEDLSSLLVAASVVFVAVPDPKLGAVVEQLGNVLRDALANPLVLVASGSVRLADLHALAPNVRLARMHPLQAVADDAPPTVLDGAVAAITALDASDEAEATQLARVLGMRPVSLDDAGAPAWHAAAVLAAGSVVALVDAASRLAATAGVDRTLAFHGLASLATGALAQARAAGPAAALTGPVARADDETVRDHVAALAERAPELTTAYDVLTRRAVALAAEDGRITDADAQRLLHALEPIGAGA